MLFTGLGIRDWGFGKAGAAPWPAPCVGPGMTAEFFESPIPNPESRGERQFALWIARLSTAIAASWIDSDRVGWAWQMRARSSAEPLNSNVSTPPCKSSATPTPTRHTEAGRAGKEGGM